MKRLLPALGVTIQHCGSERLELLDDEARGIMELADATMLKFLLEIFLYTIYQKNTYIYNIYQKITPPTKNVKGSVKLPWFHDRSLQRCRHSRFGTDVVSIADGCPQLPRLLPQELQGSIDS